MTDVELQTCRERRGGRAPVDLLKLPMVDADDPWFELWFDAAGVKDYTPAQRPLSRPGSQALEAAAATAGRGVAMLTSSLYREELASGRLIQPFGILASDGFWIYALSES